jgi:predicted phage-related endonuclease
LKDNYNINYNGKKNCDGWYTDQKQLYDKIINWEKYESKFTIFKDVDIKFKRLNNRQVNKVKIVGDFDNILKKIETFTDIHAIKPYSKVGWYLRKITEVLIDGYDIC